MVNSTLEYRLFSRLRHKKTGLLCIRFTLYLYAVIGLLVTADGTADDSTTKIAITNATVFKMIGYRIFR